MKKALKRISNVVYYYVDGKRIEGTHNRIYGNVSGIYGDVSGIYGDVSGISGDVDDCDVTGLTNIQDLLGDENV